MTSWYIIYVLTKKQPYRGQISDCAETLLDVYKNLYDFPGVSVSTYPKNLVILSEKHVLYQDKSQNWVIQDYFIRVFLTYTLHSGKCFLIFKTK